MVKLHEFLENFKSKLDIRGNQVCKLATVNLKKGDPAGAGAGVGAGKGVSCQCCFLCQAGGKATTGYGPIRGIKPEALTDHVSTILGSYEDVAELEGYYGTGVGGYSA